MTDSHISTDEVAAIMNTVDEEARTTLGEEELDPRVIVNHARNRQHFADGGPIR